MTAITATGTGGARIDGDTRPVQIVCTYDTARPCEWRMSFEIAGGQAVPWTFARDILADALGDFFVHGDGDVQICRVYPSTLIVHVGSPDGEATVFMPAAPVLALMRQSLILVPAGAESVDVDSVIAACLGAS